MKLASAVWRICEGEARVQSYERVADAGAVEDPVVPDAIVHAVDGSGGTVRLRLKYGF